MVVFVVVLFSLSFTPIQSISFHFPSFHVTPFYFTPPHTISFHFTLFHFTSIHFISLHSTSFHLTPFHFTSLYFISIHSTSLHLTLFHFTSLHFISPPFISFHFTLFLSLHYSTLLYSLNSTQQTYFGSMNSYICIESWWNIHSKVFNVWIQFRLIMNQNFKSSGVIAKRSIILFGLCVKVQCQSFEFSSGCHVKFRVTWFTRVKRTTNTSLKESKFKVI